MENIDKCKKNPENLSTMKVNERIPSSFSMSTILSFKGIENKHDVYRIKDYIKNEYLGEYLIEHAMKIINLKKMNLLTNEQHNS